MVRRIKNRNPIIDSSYLNHLASNPYYYEVIIVCNTGIRNISDLSFYMQHRIHTEIYSDSILERPYVYMYTSDSTVEGFLELLRVFELCIDIEYKVLYIGNYRCTGMYVYDDTKKMITVLLDTHRDILDKDNMSIIKKYLNYLSVDNDILLQYLLEDPYSIL